MIFKYDLSLDNLFCLDIEAANEDEAREKYEEMCRNGDVQRQFFAAMEDEELIFYIDNVWDENYTRSYYQ